MIVFPYLLHFLIGLTVCFLGTIPFGPINLTVINTTLKKGLPAAIQVSFAAALIEIFQSFVALYGGLLVIEGIERYPMIKLLLYGGFTVVGLVLIFKKSEHAGLAPRKIRLKVSHFTKGIIVALLNIQAIPFWVFFLTYMKMSRWIDYETSHLISLFLGIFTGKFLALYCFALLSMAVSKRMTHISALMNKIFGSVLTTIGLFQILKFFWFR
ncbi:MAG: LysE family transporter [Microscillaceae bacterium]|nr:LysE family transporter [Microscillaceae bacterium]